MLYRNIKNYINTFLKEEFHTSKLGVPYNNSLNQTSDNGNINYEALINKYYSINEYYDYGNSNYQKLTIKLKKDYIEKFKKLNIDLKTYTYESSDIDSFNLNKRIIVEEIYRNLFSKGIC